MVRRIANQFFYSNRPQTLRIEGKIPLGSGGAVGTVAVPGVKSVTKVSAGLYTINLDQKYKGLVGWHAHLQTLNTWNGTQTVATDGYAVCLVDDQFVNGGEGSHATVNDGDGYAQLQVIQPDGSGAAALCAGQALWFALDLKRSSVG